MAEQTGLRNNALPYPIYGVPFGIIFPMLDADGDLVTGATTPDAEVSKNGDTFADCTNESTEIATSSGMYYLLLTATEMTADVVAVIAKSATAGMKTTPMVLYPRKLVTIRSGTSASGGVSTSTIVLDASASPIDDFYNGMVVIATIDGNVEARVISDYVGSTQTASVVPDWNVAPDNNDTFVIKLPEGIQVIQSNVCHVNGTLQTAGDIIGDTNDIQSRLPAALVSGRIDASVGAMAANVVTASAIATGAIDADAIADGAIDAGAIAADAITAAKIADGAIDAGAIAADAITADKVAPGALAKGDQITGFNDLDAAGVRSAVGLASANTDTQLSGIRNRLSTTVTKTGAVVDDAGNSATTFKTDFTESTNDHFKDALLKITSGSLSEQVKKITAYNGTTKFVTVDGGFTAEPAAGDTLEVLND